MSATNDFCVYVHRKATTGEIFYVGKGRSKRPMVRCSRNKYWHNIVNKHGYIVEIIIQGLSDNQSRELEVELITWYGRLGLGTGPLVNMTPGGEGVRMDDPRVKANHASGIATAWSRPETKANHAAALSNKDFKKRHAEKTSIAVKDAWTRPEYRFKHISGIHKQSKVKRVCCIQNGLIFDTTLCAEKWLKENVNPKATGINVYKVCKGQRKSAYGYTWRYA